MINEKRTVIVRDVELYWAKLNKAVDSFGDMKWEVQCRVTGKEVYEDLKKNKEINTIKKVEVDKDKVYCDQLNKLVIWNDEHSKWNEISDHYYKFNVQRKLYKAGQDALPEHEREKNGPPEIVNGDRETITASIGNGSKGNLKLFQAPYDYKGKKGVSTVLTAVQVTDLKVYEQNSGVDFDVVDDNIPENAAAADF